MRGAWLFTTKALGAGLLILIPVYLSLLLLLEAMRSVAGLVRPIAVMLPDRVQAENALALLVVLSVCFVVGVAASTRRGRRVRDRIERSLFDRIPGYSLLRSLTLQLAGKSDETAWQPALAEIEEALVPAFIIEELDDGRYTVFVPSVPTPLAGAIYVLGRDRVHPLDVPFTQAVQSVSRWGQGSKELVAAMTGHQG
jgi:uncharacterized membrane protein